MLDRNSNHPSIAARASLAPLLALSLACADIEAASPRNYLVGPVALGHGDTLVVSVANVNAAPSCAESAEVAFFEHRPRTQLAEQVTRQSVSVEPMAIGARETVTLAPGASVAINVRGERPHSFKTLQARVQRRETALRVDPCIALSGNVFRANGHVETIGGAQLADDFSIVRPNLEVTCIGSDDCDDVLHMCEQTDGCKFTCHIAIPNDDGQACVWGSTND